MTDVTERLRAWAQNEEMIDRAYTAHGRDCLAASAEIARLRAALTEIARGMVAEDRGHPLWMAARLSGIARAALRGEEGDQK